MTEYVVVPKKATEVMFMAAMFDTRQPPDRVWDEMVKAAEPRDLEDALKEHRNQVIRELIEKAEAESQRPRNKYEDVNIPAAARYWLKSQIEGE